LIALIVAEETAAKGPIHFALRHGDLETRDVVSPDDAALIVKEHGCASCVLTIDARRLSASRGARSWASFLLDHPTLSAVVTTRTPADEAARRTTGAANRLLLENPFDAAAVVAAVRRALETSAARDESTMKRVPRRTRKNVPAARAPHRRGELSAEPPRVLPEARPGNSLCPRSHESPLEFIGSAIRALPGLRPPTPNRIRSLTPACRGALSKRDAVALVRARRERVSTSTRRSYDLQHA
jgi:DNA-binding NarL/FixJ family response regulator